MKSRLICLKLFITSLFFLSVSCLPVNSLAQEWAVSLGGLEYASACSVQPTADGGFIVAGTTKSFDSAGSDVWLVKLSSAGIYRALTGATNYSKDSLLSFLLSALGEEHDIRGTVITIQIFDYYARRHHIIPIRGYPLYNI